MTRILIIGAQRTGISPKNGALKSQPFYDLAARALADLESDLRLRFRVGFHDDGPVEDLESGSRFRVSSLIAGNALGAGGNPARLMALAAGLPVSVSALTIDTQCCSGLDAVGVAYHQLKARAGAARPSETPVSGHSDWKGAPGCRPIELVLAGGAESSSLAPIRADRQTGVPYEEAPFTPWSNGKESVVQSAIDLGAIRCIPSEAMTAWAQRSHRLSVSNQSKDSMPRRLTPALCRRLERTNGCNPLLMAPLADGACFVAMVGAGSGSFDECRGPRIETSAAESENNVRYSNLPLEVLDYVRVGFDPHCPGLSCAGLEHWIAGCEARFNQSRTNWVVSLMESFAAQILANIADLRIDPDMVNPWGGLLARGHPIGASGAVLVCDLFEHLQQGQFGLALIPAAGGLASGLLVRRLKA